MGAKQLKDLSGELDYCIRCSYCFEGCPVFREHGWESSSARAKILYAYALLHGELEPSDFIARRVFDCTLCRLCHGKCSANVNIAEVVQASRADLVEKGFYLPEHKIMVDNVLEAGNIFGDKEAKLPFQKGDTPLFVGCQYTARPNKTRGWIKLLEKLGVKPLVSKEICCGFPLKALGHFGKLEEQKRKFKELFPHKEAITLCPTCAAFLKEDHGVDARHVVTVVAEKLESVKPRTVEMKVTYHDPCDLGRSLGVFEQPRKVLKALGADVVEMKSTKDLSSCCGGGGGMLVSDAQVSDRIAERRVKEAVATGAELLVTACPTCEQVLGRASARLSEKGEKSIKVEEIFDLVWKAVK